MAERPFLPGFLYPPGLPSGIEDLGAVGISASTTGLVTDRCRHDGGCRLRAAERLHLFAPGGHAVEPDRWRLSRRRLCRCTWTDTSPLPRMRTARGGSSPICSTRDRLRRAGLRLCRRDAERDPDHRRPRRRVLADGRKGDRGLVCDAGSSGLETTPGVSFFPFRRRAGATINGQRALCRPRASRPVTAPSVVDRRRQHRLSQQRLPEDPREQPRHRGADHRPASRRRADGCLFYEMDGHSFYYRFHNR